MVLDYHTIYISIISCSFKIHKLLAYSWCYTNVNWSSACNDMAVHVCSLYVYTTISTVAALVQSSADFRGWLGVCFCSKLWCIFSGALFNQWQLKTCCSFGKGKEKIGQTGFIELISGFTII